MDSLKRLHSLATRITLALITVGALATAPFSTAAAKGLVLGGLAGVAGLWVLYRQTAGMAQADSTEIQKRATIGAILRLPLYGGALLWAYWLDANTYYGLLAAVGGLFIVQGVLVFLAFTGLDMKKDGQ